MNGNSFHLINNYKYTIYGCFAYIFLAVAGYLGLHAGEGEYIGLMAQILENDGVGDDFFAIPVAIFKLMDAMGVGAQNFSFILGLAITILAFKGVKKFKHFLFALLIFIPAPIMYLAEPSKEIFMVIFLTAFVHFYRGGSYYLSVATFMVYSALFRFYVAPFSAVLILVRLPIYIIILITAAIFLLLFIYSDEIATILYNTMGRRDNFYELRSDNVRTVWYNPKIITDFYSFLYNYVYAIMRINLPIVFHLGAKEFFLQIYNFIVLYFLIINWLAVRNRRLVISFVAMLFIYPLFEPDLGSYLRHLSSWFPLILFLVASDYERKNSTYC